MNRFGLHLVKKSSSLRTLTKRNVKKVRFHEKSACDPETFCLDTSPASEAPRNERSKKYERHEHWLRQ